ncbi:MAG: GNAT family N-acetyltransferase [Lachnospiraceae bacterium]|jgi:GNAT superfamily N-acetyltransferase|nr:GNAT family N-acetyltransferase [Lachnospiraceae bacterium]
MLTIRKASDADSAGLQELYLNHLAAEPPKELPDSHQWQELLGELINMPNYFLLVGEQDGQVVASVTLIIIKNLTHNLRPYALIENVVTHQSFRNKGYATALIKDAVTIATDHRCYKVMLMTGSKKESTLHFYEQCGFNRNDKTAFIGWL